MEFKTVFSDVDSRYIVELPSAELAVKSSIETAHGVSKILCAVSYCNIISAEAYLGEALIVGRLNYKVIYLSDNGELDSIDSVADFSERINVVGLSAGAELLAIPYVPSTDSSAEGSVIRLSALLSVTLYAVEHAEEKVLVDAEGAYTDKRTVPTAALASFAPALFSISEEFDPGPKPDKVLFFNADIILSAVEAGEDCLALSGNASVLLTTRTGDDITTRSFLLPYREDVSVSGVHTGDSVVAAVSVKAAKVLLIGDGDTVTVRFDVTAEVRCPVFASRELQYCADIFSPTAELELTRKPLMYQSGVTFLAKEEKLSGMATVDVVGDYSVGAVSCVSVEATAAYVGDGFVQAEGIIRGGVLLYVGENGLSSADFELPYSIKVLCPAAKSGDVAVIIPVVQAAQARAKRDRELEISADLTLAISVVGLGAVQVITAAECVGDKETLPAIGIYFAEKGSSLFEIAKSLSVSPDTLLYLNPELAEEPKGGERIAVFRHIDEI